MAEPIMGWKIPEGMFLWVEGPPIGLIYHPDITPEILARAREEGAAVTDSAEVYVKFEKAVQRLAARNI